jgi:hypothetical protein
MDEVKKLKSEVLGKKDDVEGPYSYSSLLSSSDNNGLAGSDDVYASLMKKEEKVLNTIDRVVNHSKITDLKKLSFIQQPLHVILIRLIETTRFIIEDLINIVGHGGAKDPKYKNLKHALWMTFLGDDRKLYVGLILIISAATIAVISNSF